MSYLFALLKSILLVLLLAVPYLVYRWAKTNRPAKTGVLTGVTFGLVVSPVSFGLCLLGFLVPLIGMLPALIGGTLTIFHGTPGYELSILVGLQKPGVVVQGSSLVWVGVFNSLFWSVIYGVIGFVLDKKFWRYEPGT